MNDNEHLPDLLSDDDLARLVSLVRSAYPAPPDGFGEAVMKKIRDENRALTQQDAKILPAADSRKTKRSFGPILRFGAAAACILFVGAVAVRILPTFTRDLAADKAAPAEASAAEASAAEAAFDMEVDEAVPESYADAMIPAEAAENAAGKTEFTAKPTETPAESPAESPAEPPAAPEMPAPDPGYDGKLSAQDAPEAVFEAAAVPEAEAADEAETLYGSWEYAAEDGAFPEESLMAAGLPGFGEEDGMSLRLFNLNGLEEKAGEAKRMTSSAENSGASLAPDDVPFYYYVRTECAHSSAFRNSYHDIPDVLIAKAGADEFGAWAAEVQREDLCGVNILSFALRFGLTAEELLSAGDVWYYLDLPEDLALTEENASAVESYYRNGGDPGKMAKRYLVYEWKTAVIREVGLDSYLAWRGPETALRSWTLEEAAEKFNLSDSTMEKLYLSAKDAVIKILPDAEVPERSDVKE
ncbi:MAG: hypothetical protein II836_06350 [Clostridia bacterium]|nr:hypothetical protein [Clostridia bacterium]